jgi:hypothetical protein
MMLTIIPLDWGLLVGNGLKVVKVNLTHKICSRD